MDQDRYVLLFALAFGVAVVYAIVRQLVLRLQLAQTRERQGRELARLIACEYSRTDPLAILSTAALQTFQGGSLREVSHVVYGAYRGYEVRCFDYSQVACSGWARPEHEQSTSEWDSATCVLITSPVSFEPLFVRPETGEDQIARMVGAQDIEFESDAFNKRYVVKCADRKLAYDVLNPRAMELLMQSERPLVIDANGRNLLVKYAGNNHLLEPKRAKELLDQACDLLDLLPQYVAGERASAASPEGDSVVQPLAQKPAAPPGPSSPDHRTPPGWLHYLAWADRTLATSGRKRRSWRASG